MMNEENIAKLVNAYPKLYKTLQYFECGDGWYGIIDELSSKLEPLIEDGELPALAVQVKEKYGSLRFYMNFETDAMSDFIKEYEIRSRSTCEVCGKAASSVIRRGYIYTACEKH